METLPPIELPDFIEKILYRLKDAGFEAWCVGGCIRDSLLGRTPEDWDIACSALPEEAAACFQGQTVLKTGLQHGTITVLWDGHPVEITTFRTEGPYSDHRRPDSVHFTKSLKEDLSRRDFTVNAMAYAHGRGLQDPYGGLKDLKACQLRCVGEPAARFSEDALRILRCLRFASVLGFSIEEHTLFDAYKTKGLLLFISQERVRDELQKLLCGKAAPEVLRQNSKILFTVLPELAPMENCAQETPYHCYNVWEHTLHVLGRTPPVPVIRWAALLHDCGKPACKSFSSDGTAHFYGHAAESEKIANRLLTRLRLSKRDTESICTLIRFHGEVCPLPEKRAKKLLGLLEESGMASLFALMRADLAGQAPELWGQRSQAIAESETLVQELLARRECLTLRDLAINGSDLLSIGFRPGPELGRTLNLLLDAVLEGALPNNRETLLREAVKAGDTGG